MNNVYRILNEIHWRKQKWKYKLFFMWRPKSSIKCFALELSYVLNSLPVVSLDFILYMFACCIVKALFFHSTAAMFLNGVYTNIFTFLLFHFIPHSLSLFLSLPDISFILLFCLLCLFVIAVTWGKKKNFSVLSY